jgi:hypothetical protein
MAGAGTEAKHTATEKVRSPFHNEVQSEIVDLLHKGTSGRPAPSNVLR